MNYYGADKKTILVIDLLAITVSFFVAFTARFKKLMESINSSALISMYIVFFLIAIVIYTILFMLRRKPRLERESYKEIWFDVTQQQIIYIGVYVLLFFIFHQTFIISRIFVGLFLIGNVLLDAIGRLLYHNYCAKRTYRSQLPVSNSDTTGVRQTETGDGIDEINANEDEDVQHVYIIGAKSIGQYGGFESFVMNLLKEHENVKGIRYHVACKRNGSGYMNVSRLPGASMVNENEFVYCNAHCCLIDVNEKMGSGQAIAYDIKAFKWVCDHVEKNHIPHPIVYILASRIGPFEGKYARRIHRAGGRIFQNPDGHEDWRGKWRAPVRYYWKLSEGIMIRNADLVVCDSKNIEKYIREEYSAHHPDTIWIPYGSVISEDVMDDKSPKYINWLTNHDLKDGHFYISVGRFVPENNFEIMIREFMASKTKKDFAVICTDYPKYMAELRQKLHFERDKRIKFVGTVYDQELLTKIRINAYGYLHGHSVGGTNPSLLEALGTTKLNLLYNVGFNREVAEEGALYWSYEEGSLSSLIDKADHLNKEEIEAMGHKAKDRIRKVYSWEKVGQDYLYAFKKAAEGSVL